RIRLVPYPKGGKFASAAESNREQPARAFSCPVAGGEGGAAPLQIPGRCRLSLCEAHTPAALSKRATLGPKGATSPRHAPKPSTEADSAHPRRIATTLLVGAESKPSTWFAQRVSASRICGPYSKR